MYKPMKDEYKPMKDDVKALWLAALLSGAYKQARGALKRVSNGEERYCCLGVLCDVAPMGAWGGKVGDAVFFDGERGMTPMTVKEWANLDGMAEKALTYLNDCCHYSFKKIAKWIDENL